MAETRRVKPIGYTEVETPCDYLPDQCSRLDTVLSISILPLSPSSLAPSLAPPFQQKAGHVLIQLPVCPTLPDTMITVVLSFQPSFPPGPYTHVPIGEHPELVISYVFLGKHVYQMC